MPFVPAPNIMQVEIRATRNGSNIENRVMVNNLGTVDAAALEAIAILVWNWAEGSYFPQLPVDVALREVVATDLTTDTGGQFTYAPDSTTVGSVTGQALPNEVSLCVSLRSTSRGRSARGRFYWMGLAITHMLTDNEVQPAFGSYAATALSGLISDISTAGGELTIVSYFHDGVARPGGPVYFPVVSALIVDPIVDSMRSRKPGVGN